MICKECGAKIDDNAAVCPFCGLQYGEAVEVEEIAPETVEETAIETGDVQESEAAQEPATDETVTNEEIDELIDENEAKRRAQMERMRAQKQMQLEEIEKRRIDKKRKQRRTRVLVALLALLCGGAIGLGVYYMGTGSDDPDDIVIVTPRPTVEVTVPPEISPTPVQTQAPVITAAPEQTESAITPAPTQKPAATKKPAAVTKPKATKKPASAASGSITAALATGGEVIKSDGKTYMSFTANGKTYYAKVSDNTTSSFISGKPMTISAYKTSETYNGNAVYAIKNITHYNGSYILPTSGTKLLTEADLSGKTASELRLARNEIYARHGRKFNDSTLQSYFDSCSWYKAKNGYNYSNDGINLNSIEKANINFIKNYESKLN